ncbi:hypothetical protein [Gimesia sp.]|uniref:hypothetical protein n=1 Tax=Gimesia sp. TaxID=2024833 RepID=UPI000C3ECD3D|nr:hypothetical protein [Gimesia sp.]MAX38034.1 hypothetical protein [Gimesia sp.]HAH44104.1 hypothetical protein [Planctomycetaceae bacterium]HBL47303.1 hypothetical protein [Planctomycetaceae bacterium]|tara:strand:+ start:87 stop:725 length:639 start_codon:yes stop_codon:yes gene_type:complete
MKRITRNQVPFRYCLSLATCITLVVTGNLPGAFAEADAIEAAKPETKQGQAPLIIPPEPQDNLSKLKDEGWLKDPFKNIQTDVKSVITDFDEGQTTQPAKTTQPRIISRLDTLVEMLEKSCKKGGGGAGANPSRPANSSTLGKGPGGQGELKAPDKKGRNWADLTPKQREKILQSRTEGFPPGYEDILADYFRRLARNQAVDKSETTPEKQD